MSTPTSPETPKIPDPKQQWSASDYKDYFQKELDQIQAIISRMAGNSFQCKGWAVGIITIVFAISKDSSLLNGWQSLILFLPVVTFWYLDGFFLYTEQCYRHLFNDVVRRRVQENNWEYLFNYNHTRFEHERVRNQSFWLHHLPVYFKNRFDRLYYQLTGRGKQAPQRITTIVSVMCSKTLLPFYLLPTLFVSFISLKNLGYIQLPESKQEKEVVVVKVDSSSLGPVLRALEKSKVEVKKDSM